jgi:hypothetical protein
VFEPGIVFNEHRRRVEIDVAIAVQVVEGAEPLERGSIAVKTSNELLHG